MSYKNCIFYRKQKGSEPFCDVTATLKKDGSGYCDLNADCYYKQLQAITAENDLLKAEICNQKKTGEFCQDCKDSEQLQTITAKAERYEKILKEIKALAIGGMHNDNRERICLQKIEESTKQALEEGKL